MQPLESPKEASILEDFSSGLWRSQFPRSFFEMSSFGQGERGWAGTTPAVDVTETDKAYEISAELPGMFRGAGLRPSK